MNAEDDIDEIQPTASADADPTSDKPSLSECPQENDTVEEVPLEETGREKSLLKRSSGGITKPKPKSGRRQAMVRTLSQLDTI